MTSASTRPEIDAAVGAQILERTAAEYGRRQRRHNNVVNVGIVALGVSIVLFWQFGLGLIVNPRYVSSPLEIAARLVEMVADGYIFEHVFATVFEAGLGFLLGSTLGLASAFGLSMTRRGYEIVEPLLLAFYSIPKIALAPLFILWFGLGYTPKVLMAALMVFFIVFMNTMAGIRDINPGLIRVSRVFGASRWDLMKKIMLPAASPAIVASVRITFTRAIEGAVLAEFIAATQGLGFIIVRASRQFDVPTMFAGIVIIAAIVMSMNAALRQVENRLLPWHSKEIHG